MINKNLAFDIGCHDGLYTTKLLENSFLSVVSIDPHKELFTNVPTQVNRVFKACSNINGMGVFYDCRDTCIATSELEWTTKSRFSYRHKWFETSVEYITIDKLVSEFGVPDHIKIDVEGHEEKVLLGMSRKYAPELCFEWTEELGDSALRGAEYLASIGYTRFGFIYTDDYLIKPRDLFDISEFKKQFEYNKDQKTAWGMIWAF